MAYKYSRPVPGRETLVINSNNTMVKKIAELYEDENRKEDALTAANHIYDLALLNHRQLEPEAMVKFIDGAILLMRLYEAKDFSYELPEKLIAQSLLRNVICQDFGIEQKSDTLEHKHFIDLPDFLEAGDCW